MNKYWLSKLFEVLNIQTNSENEKLMVLYLDKELRKLKLPYIIDAAGNLLVTKGKATTYPCVTSHMDTVHSFVDDFKVYYDEDDNDLLFAMNGKHRVGIGGDDKCGVFGCLYLLETIPQIKVVFFSREERGCRGSEAIDKRFFKDCRYLIQLDRNGSRDFIQTYWSKKTISHEFSSEIGLIKKKYKYKNATGTVTDVMKLWNNKVGVSCINLSCGYYKAHTAYEYISISSLWHSVKFTEEVVNTMKPKKYPSLPPPPIVVNTTHYNSGLYSICSMCYKYKKDTLLYVLGEEYHEKKGKKVCYPCKEKLKKGGTKKSPIITPTQKKIESFACCECGRKPEELNKGEKIKRINGDLYCNNCESIFFVPKNNPKNCWMCNRIIPKDHKIFRRYSMPVCEDCSCPSDPEWIED